MDKAIFAEAIKDIYYSFDLKTLPDPAAVEIWFNKVSFIPEMAVNFIVTRITDQESKPRNIGVSFLVYWKEYQRSNPQNIFKETNHCDECSINDKPLGFLRFIAADGYRYICRCGHCDNWHLWLGSQKWAPAFTKAQILSRGWKIVEG